MGAPEILILAVVALVAWGWLLLVRAILRWAQGRVERDIDAGLHYGPDADDDFWDRP